MGQSSDNMTPQRIGQKPAKSRPDHTYNPHRGQPDEMFLGQPNAAQKELERLAAEWDAAHPDAT